jgi:hypothetical protein
MPSSMIPLSMLLQVKDLTSVSKTKVMSGDPLLHCLATKESKNKKTRTTQISKLFSMKPFLLTDQASSLIVNK